MKSHILSFICVTFLAAFPGGASAQNFVSSNLPIIIINTDNGTVLDEPKVMGDMGIIDNGPGARNNVTDPFNAFNGRIAIEIRGSTSQFLFDKKQYAVELKRNNGEDLDTALLGMPSEEDWILFAPYNDKSLMRDVLAYKLGRDLGHYASRTQYCELILNGDYVGVYVLEEKIKRGKNRVDIAKLNPDENSGDDLTGGYIIKIDKATGSGNDGWKSEFAPWGPTTSEILFQYHYPDPAEITIQQKEYIQTFMRQFEAAMQGNDFRDPVNGYRRYIDVDSFIDFLIINEVSKNVDGYRLSTFMHKQKDSDGGKLVMGPLWDFNLSFGNADYCTSGTAQGLVLEFNSICPDDGFKIPFWWYQLMADPYFTSKLWTRWSELRTSKLSLATMQSFIDSTALVLHESQTRNFQRWPVLGVWVWPNYFVGENYQSEVSWLSGWVNSRLQWLDDYFARYQDATPVEEPSANDFFISSFSNPFNEALDIEYRIQRPGNVEFKIFDLTGRKIEVVNSSHTKAGNYRQSIGKPAKSGLHICHVSVNGKLVKTMKVIKR